ncbi:MAG: hypothetical protein HDS59_06025 [Barnesiella sp.]|nr:hypothetical protein [Barnesiella sp.]
MSHFVRTIVFVFSFSLISACSTTTKNSDTNDSKEFNDSVSISFNGDEYEIVPVALSIDSVYAEKFLTYDVYYNRTLQDFRKICADVCTDGHLAQFVSWIGHPNYAFRNAQGKYLTFDNDGDYSDLCLLPALIYNFNELNLWYPEVGGYVIIKNLCESHKLNYDNVRGIGIRSAESEADLNNWQMPNEEISTWNTPEINQALETHYNQEIKDCVTGFLHAWALYLNGYKDDIDVEYRDQIEKYIFDQEHPEYASFYKFHYSYNIHDYYSKKLPVSLPVTSMQVYPIESQKFITIGGESLPKGTLILSLW